MDQLASRVLEGLRADLLAGRIPLPSLPVLVLKVRTTLHSPSAKASQVAALISKDPAMSARVLAVANSAYYRTGKPVAGVHRALVKLGSKAVGHIVTILSLAKMYDVRAHPQVRPHLERLWQRSTLAAALAEHLARDWGHLSQETAMMAGLIHNIGGLPILTWAERMPQLLDARVVDQLLSRLQGEVGALMLSKWDFPAELVTVAAEHLDLTRETVGLPDYVDLVQVALLAGYRGSQHPWGSVDWGEVPAVQLVGLDPDAVPELMELAGPRVGELRALLGPREASARRRA